MKQNFKSALDFSGKTVFVAGGASGIGNGIACAFRDHGAEVIVTGVQPRAFYDTDRYSELSEIRFIHLDATKDDQVKGLASQVPEIDVLVNSIGTIRYDDEEYQIDAFRQTFEESLIGPAHVFFVLVDKLRPRKGCIIAVTAISAWYATPGSPGYSASRAAVPTLVKTLGTRWAAAGIRVNAIAPGIVETTNLSEHARTNEELYRASLSGIPLGRWTTREELGGVAMFLASPIAGNITGQTICVDGGRSMLLKFEP